MFVCACVWKKGCPCWLIKAPRLFVFGNLRNKVKEDKRGGGGRENRERDRERKDGDRRGGELTLPLCAAQCDMWSRSITTMKM